MPKAKPRNGNPVTVLLQDARGAAACARVRELVLKRAVDPLWGTPIGRLFLTRDLSARHFDCAQKFASLRAAADRVKGLSARTVAAIDYGRTGALGTGRMLDRADDAAIVAAVDAAESAIGEGAAMRAVLHVVIENHEPVGTDMRLDLISGLERLARHWRLQ